MMKNLSVILLIVCFASLSLAQSFKWENCGNENDIFQVQTVTMSPDPAQPGQNVTIKATGTQSETVTGGTWDTKVYLGIIKVMEFHGNVCDLIPDCPCPCPSGTYTTYQSLGSPGFSPKGTYSGKYTAVDQNGNNMTCISYSFQMA